MGKRRAQLFGQHFVAMTDQDTPYTSLDPAFATKAIFHPGNKTYEVTSMVHGLYQEIFDLLSAQLNFTYTLYKRQDGVWGFVKDGQPVGILNDLFREGGADIVAGAFGYTLERDPYVSYLPPFTNLAPGLFIKRQFKEATQWTMFFNPLGLDLWVATITTSVIIATWIYATNWIIIDDKKGCTFCGCSHTRRADYSCHGSARGSARCTRHSDHRKSCV